MTRLSKINYIPPMKRNFFQEAILAAMYEFVSYEERQIRAVASPKLGAVLVIDYNGRVPIVNIWHELVKMRSEWAEYAKTIKIGVSVGLSKISISSKDPITLIRFMAELKKDIAVTENMHPRSFVLTR